MRKILLLTSVLLLLGLTQSSTGAAPDTKPATTQPMPPSSVTTHQITLHGQPFKYEATADTLTLHDDEGKPRANFFFIAYRALPAAEPSTRPITFVFNGGPGAASVFLHFGTVGPMRVDLADDGNPGAPPHRLVENQDTWLDATDLVFIDPVGTGFSRPAEGVSTKEFWGVDEDIASVADFIRLYLTKYNRWSSPKFLAGESYGTTRAAGLSLYLADHFGIDLNGIVLISTVLNFQAIDNDGDNDLPFALFLPSYTAVAEYHHKIGGDPDQARQASETWAINQYITALAKGKDLTADEQAAVAQKLSDLTGLPQDFIRKSRFRISSEAFRKHLLNDQEKILGRYDARLTADDPTPATDDLSQDPSDSLYYPVYASVANDYIRRTLKYETDMPYRVIWQVWPWDFGDKDGFLEVSSRLREAMLQNRNLKLLVAAGYYDLATPFASVDYTIGHMDLGHQISQRITQTYYASGHMIYHVASERQKLRADVGAFIAAAVPATQP